MNSSVATMRCRSLKKAELIEGVVHMPSPVRHDSTATRTRASSAGCGSITTGTPGVDSGDNGSLRLDLGNMPQPDGYLIVRPERGGRVRISADDYIEGGPELVAEVSASTADHDLGEKLAAYLRNEVCEYIVWRVVDRALDWFVLRDGRYERLEPGADGILRSVVFPGLWLDPAALTGGDSARVLAVVLAGYPFGGACRVRRPPRRGSTSGARCAGGMSPGSRRGPFRPDRGRAMRADRTGG